MINSNDELEEKKEKQVVMGKKERIKSTKKNGKAFSSVLLAQSKWSNNKTCQPQAACGLERDLVVNIDAIDKDNDLAAVEYINDIYQYCKDTKEDGCVHDYMSSQPDINAKMRSILVDCLIEVHIKFELMLETLYLTLNIGDQFLSKKFNDFVCISDNVYVSEQVLMMEKTILTKLKWYLTIATPYVFLVWYIKVSTPSNDKEEHSLDKDSVFPFFDCCFYDICNSMYP
ncbi:Cyclin-B1-4, partial [Mucuna pruriens]